VQKKKKRIRVQQDRRMSAKSSPHCHRYQQRHHQQQRHQHQSQKSTEKPATAISNAIINSNDISIIPINQHKNHRMLSHSRATVAVCAMARSLQSNSTTRS
jgi:predicted DNA repair protein MutK